MDGTKPWYTSKTIWIGVTQVVVGVAAAKGYVSEGFVQDILQQAPEVISGLIAATLGVVSIWTRAIARSKLTRPTLPQKDA